ncbi:MAG: NAD-binding protein [Bacilli bacterium]|nr:NAD-binding protein [Bacilli bacterium]
MAIKNKIIIIGCGRLGSSIANYFSGRGENIVVIDSSEASFTRLDNNFSGYTAVGDASDLSFLENQGYIETARKVIITSGDDNLNLFLTHVADKIYGVEEIYVRFDDPQKSLLISGEPNVRGIYPFQLSFDNFLALDEEDEK